MKHFLATNKHTQCAVLLNERNIACLCLRELQSCKSSYNPVQYSNLVLYELLCCKSVWTEVCFSQTFTILENGLRRRVHYQILCEYNVNTRMVMSLVYFWHAKLLFGGCCGVSSSYNYCMQAVETFTSMWLTYLELFGILRTIKKHFQLWWE